MGEWNDADPLADLLRIIEALREEPGYAPEIREEEGYYCRVCQQEVAALVPVTRFLDQVRLGEPFCPTCQSQWPLLLKRREG